jgi:hypothetical protein
VRRSYSCAVAAAIAVLVAVAWAKRDYLVPTTTLSVRIGEAYENVVKESTFPVAENSMPPGNGFGTTDVDAPAVVIAFNDPTNGFTLPPTKFAGITYLDGKVLTIRTSPMLESLPFEKAIRLMNRLQADFKKSGWKPVKPCGERAPSWFDSTSPAGLAELRRGSTRELVVPRKYAMYFNFTCWDNCSPAPNDKSVYLIDISMGPDR